MTKAQSAQFDAAMKTITTVATVLLGANGDPGLVGDVAEIRKDTRGIKDALPTLTTKAECKETREGCSKAGDKQYTRRKDWILGAFAFIGMVWTLYSLLHYAVGVI